VTALTNNVARIVFKLIYYLPLIIGVTILLYQTFVYPYLVKLLRPINTSRIMIVSALGKIMYQGSTIHVCRIWGLQKHSQFMFNFADIVYGSSDYLPMYSTSQRALVINNAKYCINVES